MRFARLHGWILSGLIALGVQGLGGCRTSSSGAARGPAGAPASSPSSGTLGAPNGTGRMESTVGTGSGMGTDTLGRGGNPAGSTTGSGSGQ